MRLIFMGTPDFAAPALAALHQAGHDICAVYTRPPARQKRGMAKRKAPVHEAGEKLGLTVFTPDGLSDEKVQAQFVAHKAELAVVVAYGLLLPEAILAAPVHGCWNIHASLLPRWRGAAPIQRAIMAGDKQTGICIMQMQAGLDTGAVLWREEMPIGGDEAAGSVHDRLMMLGAKAIVAAIDAMDKLKPQAQSEHGVTYAKKITKAEAQIDWTRSAADLDAHIRGLAPAPAAWCDLTKLSKGGGGRLKILQARPVDAFGQAGEILSLTPLTIACGEGALVLERVQKASKAPMDGEDFIRGAALACGDILA